MFLHILCKCRVVFCMFVFKSLMVVYEQQNILSAYFGYILIVFVNCKTESKRMSEGVNVHFKSTPRNVCKCFTMCIYLYGRLYLSE